jgi:hypothetical protein
MLEGEGESFKNLRSQVQGIRDATAPAGIQRLNRARTASGMMAGLLIERGIDDGILEAKELLKSRLTDGTYYQATALVDQASQTLEKAYVKAYSNIHIERSKLFREAIDQIKGSQDWVVLEPEIQSAILAPLTSRYCEVGGEKNDFLLEAGKMVCEDCRATIPQMESDIAAVDGLKSIAVQMIQKVLKPEEKVERVRVSSILNSLQTLNTREEVDEALKRLREALMERIDAGVKIILE